MASRTVSAPCPASAFQHRSRRHLWVDARGQTMASDRPQALQDTFLDHVRKHEVPVTIFLASGIKLQGSVREFDSYSLLLVRGRQAQLIYKRAVSTIMPGEPVRMPQSPAEKKSSDTKGLHSSPSAL